MCSNTLIRGNWETSRRELNGPHFIAVVSTERNFLNNDYDEYAASTTRNAIYCRLIAVVVSLSPLFFFGIKYERRFSGRTLKEIQLSCYGHSFLRS